MQEQAQKSQFKKALAPRDQRALEQLFIYANLHVAEAAYTAFELPIECGNGAVKIDRALRTGNGSSSRKRCPAHRPGIAPRVRAVVVLPTPPFWLAIAIVCMVIHSEQCSGVFPVLAFFRLSSGL
jgi:hypothetical protein